MTVGLNLLICEDVAHWGQLTAASVTATIPLVVLYTFLHRWVVQGLAAGAVTHRGNVIPEPGQNSQTRPSRIA